MTTILIGFLTALVLALVLTPLARGIGLRFGAMDQPSERKVHPKPIARTGGLAMFVAFWLSIGLIRLSGTTLSDQLPFDQKFLLVFLGVAIVFGIGLYDDFHRLSPGIKFVFQILGASAAFWGGIRVDICAVDLHLFSPVVSWMATVFWFCLLINALNLIDGLDGLSSGIVFFSALVMTILALLGQRYIQALLLAIIVGVVIGFLVYNFHPASIFMGDSGSYFLGYSMAALSTFDSSSKTQLSATILIALVSLGLPVFETLLTPIRRFMRGRNPFRPDREHIHHRLLRIGLDTPAAVTLMYGFSLLLCFVAVLMVNLSDKQAGLVLVLIGCIGMFFFRRLGYFDYVGHRDVIGWIRDIGDAVGVSRERRQFLDIQIDIARSNTIEEMWRHVCRVLEWLEFDFGEVKIVLPQQPRRESRKDNYDAKCIAAPHDHQNEDAEALPEEEEIRVLAWQRNGFDRHSKLFEPCLLKTELPLMDYDTGHNLGTLWLVKDMRTDPVSHYTLKRVEHLRRSMVQRLATLQDGKKTMG